jgi:hypothetical protein
MYRPETKRENDAEILCNNLVINPSPQKYWIGLIGKFHVMNPLSVFFSSSIPRKI